MTSRPVTPESLGPELSLYVSALVGHANRLQGSPDLGEVSQDLCQHYRALAIALLTDDGESGPFFHWLLHSPLAYRQYLATVAMLPESEARYRCASFVDPILDAIAAYQWRLAAEVANLSASDWLVGEEYEEDFCYGEWLRRIANDANADCSDLIARWKQIVQTNFDVRLDVVETLSQRDSADFVAALQTLLDDQENKAQAMASPTDGSVFADDYPFFPNRWVSIEGLALLAIAERMGLEITQQFERCPALVRTSDYAPFQPLAYPNSDLKPLVRR